MLTLNNLRRTWTRDVDLFITPSQSAKTVFVEAGLEEERIAVKPNFVESAHPQSRNDEGHFLFVGRLVEHKGITTMLQTWASLPQDVRLRILGDGPMEAEVRSFASAHPNVTYVGRVSRAAVFEEMSAARALVFPSLWYEPFGMGIIEAFASGLPVIASEIGSLGPELVEDGVTGLLFQPGVASAMANAVLELHHHPKRANRMGRFARLQYEGYYSPESNYQSLIKIYERALAIRRTTSC